MSNSAPLLSIILCSRNDRYMGDSRWRLATALDYLGERVAELGRTDDVEVLVADWGSEVPLAEVVTLQPTAAAITSFITVPPDLARDLQADSPFPEVLALNAAARRAKGRYIGRIDQDILVGGRFLEDFLGWVGEGPQDGRWEKALMFANRRRIPYRFVSQGPNFANVTRFVKLAGASLKVERHNRHTGNLFWTSYVGIWMLHRNLWDECGGYDERMIYYNWMEADMICRLRPAYPIVDLGAMTGHDFYHLEHYHPRTALFARPHVIKNKPVNLTGPPPVRHPNGPDWGLRQHTLEITSARIAPEPVEFVPAHRNDDVSDFGRMMWSLVRETVNDRAVIYWTTQSRLWTRRWRRLRSALGASRPSVHHEG
jgi:hypothetical protein